MATVRLLGVDADDVLVGTKLAHEGSAVQEVDVVVNSGGRLHVIDCKLTTSRQAELPVGSQIREAATTKFHLGDGAAKVVLLPGRTGSYRPPFEIYAARCTSASWTVQICLARAFRRCWRYCLIPR